MAVISTENALHYVWGSSCDGWHLAKTSELSVIQERVPSGAGEIRHLHENAEQFFYVLSGIATLEVAGHVHKIKPLHGIHIPAKTPHQLSNQGESELTFLVISTPPSHGDRVEIFA
ncbi:Uncharacterized conserved protein, contains double-stranded beta-helix domain [Plesiomonas shigelloides]|uniref:cupin domain-containing protein n=1 Tax=Plesiomonas shigelloides TaxID=703 RepID=UPI000D8FBEB5|nr:cupin domain-containing protein [Plesiomonas shigelloides]SPZ37424.1 Uncharacterized conserved protein, contains double-stranded beta-helix domain [Plesiomonas shigelloides]